MKAKVLIAAFLIVIAATMPVLAQGNGNGGDNAGQNDNGNNGNGNGNDQATDGNGNAGNGNGNGNGNNGGGNGAAANPEPSTSDVTVVPEADLLAMVKAGQAVSLGSLLPNVQERTGGQIIDAQLVRTERALIYVIEVMTPEGRVGTEYYNARSGIHIEAR